MSSKCEICGLEDFKYKCPKCFRKTCSLACSKKHKADFACDGERTNSVDYISNDTFKKHDDLENGLNHLVQRDYNFLTNFKRKYEVNKKDSLSKVKGILYGGNTANKRFKNNSRDNRGLSGPYNPTVNGENTELDEMVCKVISRRGVNCLVLPNGMQRSLQNKSKWDKPLDCFVWTIEVILLYSQPDANGNKKFVHVTHRMKETNTVAESIGKIIYSKCLENFNIEPKPPSLENAKDDISKGDRTEAMANLPLHFLTKWFPRNYNKQYDSKQLIEIPSSGLCIGEIFKNKTVIEFPTIYITDSLKNVESFGYTIVKKEEPQILPQLHEEVDSNTDAPDEISSKIQIPAYEKVVSGYDDIPVDTSIVNDVEVTVNANNCSDSDSDDYDPGVTLDFL
ncbi:hypothetical protein TPHA_0E01400 [Tetrapisispora phaffii CBS 4417]|uniref:HIT-type domain-containing protein n=1 Tax=Tetrapisispora phaffii (strain ATCC 24235 / CBS 4417 / NBRC 1672 / NRRL Y-8282 / UCD 70-5) TaxID=1071381 RepID=G8BTK7_TETPH|nr:hypothetical protein TPHA_0E01400 [Tetrapisispora phaffii CBS 4417]CCE63235.1 hypothetical protein TPHA_0E01400 [Tetrapisispora phaffii CBS 4417]